MIGSSKFENQHRVRKPWAGKGLMPVPAKAKPRKGQGQAMRAVKAAPKAGAGAEAKPKALPGVAPKPKADPWEPVRAGAVYCAPACGAGCTHKAYQQAVRKAGALVKRLGKDWYPRVWENCGWHYEAVHSSETMTVSESQHGGDLPFTADFNPIPHIQHYVRSTHLNGAIETALGEAEFQYENLGRVLKAFNKRPDVSIYDQALTEGANKIEELIRERKAAVDMLRLLHKHLSNGSSRLKDTMVEAGEMLKQFGRRSI